MAEKRLHVHVDESGDTRLGSSGEGTSHLYHVVAIVVDDQQRKVAEHQLDAISKLYFGGGELKSANIGGDNARRLRVLQALADIDFGYYALMVNKDRITRDSGYQWKTTFFKATRRRMYTKVTAAAFDEMLICSHRYGSQDYMDSFAGYLSDMTAPNLFYTVSHSFITSSESRLAQLADVLAGTLGYCFDPSRTSEYTPQFRSLLSAKEISIILWPVTLPGATVQPETDDELDRVLHQNLLERVRRYLVQLNDGSSADDAMRDYVLSKLLLARLYNDAKEHAIYSDRLIDMLVNAGYERLTKQMFTANIVGRIRDQGIILAGTSQGYKLALSVGDVMEYLEHNKSVIYPMFSRIMKAQETVKAITPAHHDILAGDPLLRNVVESFYNGQLVAGSAAITYDEHDHEGIEA